MTEPQNPDDELEDDLSAEFEQDDDLDPGFTPMEGGFQEIPSELYSTYSGKPFDRCVECAAELAASQVSYGIQKVYRNGECIFEFALCFECQQNMEGSMSEESRAAIEKYFETHALTLFGIDACNLCGEVTRGSADEYVLGALAVGRRVLGGGHMVCQACTEGLEGLMSVATRRSMDDFTNRNFPGVPEHLGLPVGTLSL